MTELGLSARAWLTASMIVLAASGIAAGHAAAQDQKGAGIVVSSEATASDVGLPIYPGAKPYKKTENDSEAGRASAWFGGFGLKIAGIQLQSSDSPPKVAEFYRKALGKYGKVLDCTDNAPKQDDSGNALTCGDDKPNPGGMLFKAGTKKDEHLVAIDPHGSGSTFSLVYLRLPKD